MYGTALLSKLRLYYIVYDTVLQVRVLPHCVNLFRVCVFLHSRKEMHNGVLHPVKKCTAFFQQCVLHLFFCLCLLHCTGGLRGERRGAHFLCGTYLKVDFFSDVFS